MRADPAGGVDGSMSYDFALYCQRAQDLPAPPALAAGQVAVYGPDRVADEDLEGGVLAVIGRKRMLYSLHVEGVVARGEQGDLDGWLREVIALTKGVLVDLQSDRFETPTKAGQIATTEGAVKPSGWMSFLLADGEAFYDGGFARTLTTIAEVCPEALPARWGYWEPLQETVEGGDMAPLLAAFAEDTSILMKGRTPIGDISLSLPCRKTFERYHPRHAIRRQFMLANLSFELRAKAFADPRQWPRLMTLFERLCPELGVVYATIQTTPRWDLGWFWYGLPQDSGHTLCLGPAYRTVWPEAEAQGRPLGPDHVILTTDRFGNAPPAPPPDLREPDAGGYAHGNRVHYAPVFPFDYKYRHDRYIW